MAELRVERRLIHEIVEQGYGGKRVVRGVFDSAAEAQARYWEIAAREPGLVQSMSLGVSSRLVETVTDVSLVGDTLPAKAAAR